MIRNDSELKETRRRIQEQREAVVRCEQHFLGIGLSPSDIELAMAPTSLLLETMERDVEEYEKLKRGDLAVPHGLRDLGQYLIKARIARGLSQRKLAETLDVDESSVSRDERNDYHGITIERACKILEALDVEASVICKLRSADKDAVLTFTRHWESWRIDSVSHTHVQVRAVPPGVIRSADYEPGVRPKKNGAA